MKYINMNIITLIYMIFLCLLDLNFQVNASKVIFPKSTTFKQEKLNRITLIRGGKNVSKKKKVNISEKETMFGSVNNLLKQVLPASRAYLLLALFCTAVDTCGLPAPAIFGLDSSRLFDLWRPITSMAYFGPISMAAANNVYFLLLFGQVIEKDLGTGANIWFLTIQTILLTILGFLFGFPLQAQALVAAIIYVSSRMHPMEKIPFNFGLVITSWQLPFAKMGIDILTQQSIGAAWPYILGIFTGHIFHFFTNIWPKLGGNEYLKTPNFFIRKFGDKNDGFEANASSKSSQTNRKGKKSLKKGRKMS